MGATVSIEDHETLQPELVATSLAGWHAWLAEIQALSQEILVRRGGKALNADDLWQAARADQEARDV